MNSVNIVGRLGRDPEVRVLQSGTAVADFSIALSEKFTDKNGNKQETTHWFDVTAWGKTAELVEQYLQKGQRVGISGKLAQDTWETEEGQKRSRVKIVMQTLTFLDGAASKEDKPPKQDKNNKPPAQDDDDIPF